MKNILKRERISDLLTTALEGGSNYWYNLPDIDEILSITSKSGPLLFVDRVIIAIYDFNLSLKVYDIEDPKLFLGELNLETIERGEEVMLEKYQDYFMDILSENDDAETADVWFQCCVLGNVIFC